MLAQDVENIVRAKPNMSGSQIPLTGGVADTHTHTVTHVHRHIRKQTRWCTYISFTHRDIYTKVMHKRRCRHVDTLV